MKLLLKPETSVTDRHSRFNREIPRCRFLKLRILVRAGSPAHPLPVAWATGMWT